ncbi:putative amidase [Beauveria bassiana]|uniref:Amidase-like protein n=1 Tax=Beauveria bassiana (strain ARSEF 2860) TaxID=655819 RepID=J5JU10_BEAB2|nr:amidase-like protein [Beauveria bassiana ARSEF 2860]EJP66046.1 amidase-like protein [Beauveria bassiana ARSEF 2860]KAF1736034.1 putative amidase [Beauveria bassiana]KAH8711606.1 putative amidase [Beauveria bassiana]
MHAAILSAAALLVVAVGAFDTQLTPPLLPLQENANTTELFPMADCHGLKLEEATIDQMQEAMANTNLTSLKLVGCYLTRIIQTQDYINSVMQINPDVFAIAAQRDEERQSGKPCGPLHGIPFTVKDNIATKDNMETTAGSLALLGSIVPRDAHVVAKLREAGAVLLGKATLSEWADMRSSNYSEGFSGRAGQCRSSYNLTVNPGGSSSGSAVGVAANVAAFSLGTETDGSVINPASRNALVGFKPTVGRTSRAGVIPETEHQDSVGTFGRTVRDAVYAFDAIHGPDPRDNYTLADGIKKAPEKGYASLLANKSALKCARFGLPWMSYWRFADDEQLAALTQLLDMMRDAGATIINGTEITDHETIVSPDGWDWDWGNTARGRANESELTYVKVDFYNNMNAYLDELTNTNMRTVDDIIQYNFDNDGAEGGRPWPLGHPAWYSGQDVFLASQETRGVQDETYFQALAYCQSTARRGIDDALRHNGTRLNGLLVPPGVGQSYQQAAQAGYPAVTIPVGVSAESGMPFGMAILQTAWREDELVRWASAIEDLQLTSNTTTLKRTRPTWRGYLERNVPVPF